jgi:hypothetical protein
MRRPLLVAALLVLSAGLTGSFAPTIASPRVAIIATPDGGIQPQASVAADGTLHLIYFKGDPAHGDVFYTKRGPRDADFLTAIRVNSVPGSAIATGSVRGGQIALGRNGRIHVAWNASQPVERDGAKVTPMWYARLGDDGSSFEPQRAIGTHTKYLDGGGSVAADRSGRVFVVWHAAGTEDGEPHRRLYVALSHNDGRTFGPDEAYGVEGGACGCCGIESIVDTKGRLQLLYRAAAANVQRDAMWLTVGDKAEPVRLQEWQLPACPMTTFALTSRGNELVAAWETKQQIYSAILTPEGRHVSPARPMSGTGLRKHPSVAVNAAGDTLYAWTEGTAWARGGTLAWELHNRSDAQVASQSGAGAVPVWSLVAAVARPDGSFAIIH